MCTRVERNFSTRKRRLLMDYSETRCRKGTVPYTHQNFRTGWKKLKIG